MREDGGKGIFLRIPTENTIDRDTARWYGWVHRQLPEADIDITNTGCYGIAEGRNRIVDEFLRSECSYLWMIDSDIRPPLTLDFLEGMEQYPILAAPYRGFIGGLIIWHVWYFIRMKEDRPIYGSMPQKKFPTERYFHADAAGAGCLLIHREVLENTEKPYFQYDHYMDGKRSTEDVRFYRDHGGVMIDSHYVCRHYRDADLEELVRARVK